MLRQNNRNLNWSKNIVKIIIFSSPTLVCLILLFVIEKSPMSFIPQKYFFVISTISITVIALMIDRHVVSQRQSEELIQKTREDGIRKLGITLAKSKHEYLSRVVRTMGSVLDDVKQSEKDSENLDELDQYYEYLQHLEHDLQYFEEIDRPQNRYKPGDKLSLESIEVSINKGIQRGKEDATDFITTTSEGRQNIVRTGDPLVESSGEVNYSIVFAVKNLVTNAFKYSDQEITYWTQNVENGVQLKIEDKGIGITQNPEDLKIPFVRGIDKEAYKLDYNREAPSGNGIGLAIVEDVVTKFRGDFHLGNNDGGRSGVTATLFFPYIIPDYSQPNHHFITDSFPMLFPLVGVILLLLGFIFLDGIVPVIFDPIFPTPTPLPEDEETACTELDFQLNQCDPWFGGKPFQQGLIQTRYDHDSECAFESNVGLSVTYNAEGEYAFWGIDFQSFPNESFDISNNTHLSFYIRSHASINGNQFRVGLKDTEGTEVKVESSEWHNVKNNWELVEIPLSAFVQSGLNTSHIINLNFDFNRSDHGASSLCFSNFRFL